MRCKKRIANLRFGLGARDAGADTASEEACVDSDGVGHGVSAREARDEHRGGSGMPRSWSRSIEPRRGARPLRDAVDQLRARSALQFSEELRLSVPAGDAESSSGDVGKRCVVGEKNALAFSRIERVELSEARSEAAPVVGVGVLIASEVSMVRGGACTLDIWPTSFT